MCSTVTTASSIHDVSDEHGDHGFLTNVFYGLRSIYIPTSPHRALEAQKVVVQKP